MNIKNLIEYYYNIKISDLHRNHKEYRFKYKNNNYLFLPVTRYEKELIDINNIISNNDNYDQIIFNIEDKVITPANNNYYILLKKTLNPINIEKAILNPLKIPFSINDFQSIDRSNWVFLWSEKIDYIEYQQLHLENEYPLLRNSVNYFIGMGENAISYIYETYNNIKNNDSELVVAHKRIKKRDFNSPLNLIVDYKSRDVAEYLKYIFLNNDYDYLKINDYIRSLNFNQLSYQLLYGRMLFPTFYFDIYDQIVNKNIKEIEIIKILKRTSEYENYLINIYNIISKVQTIERINWL